jgi:WXG100 family type VII secretion target
MSWTLKYNPEQLRARATELRTYAASHADAVDRVTNLVNRLPDVWTGTAEKKLVASFQELASGFENFDDTLEAFAVALETAASDMEDADNAILAKIKAL